MPNTHTTLKSLFDDVADAIREKDGTSATIVADNFPERVLGIPVIPAWDGTMEGYIPKRYTLTLSGITDYGFELVNSNVITVQRNPNKNLYDGGYRSLNKYQPSSVAAMRIDFSGYPVFNIYIQSYAQTTYDYIVATTLDAPEPSETYTMASTSGNQIKYVDFSSYTKVSYPNDGGSHHIYVFYKKNSNQNQGDDWGYVLIEK